MAAAFCFLSHLLALNTSKLPISLVPLFNTLPGLLQTFKLTYLLISLQPDGMYKFMALTIVVSDFIAPSIVDDDNNQGRSYGKNSIGVQFKFLILMLLYM